MPWALKISSDPAIGRIGGTYHPTFLYESLWCLGVAALVIWADKRFRLGHGRAFALYVAAYCAGRSWIEYMRVDEAHHILGLRLNVWTALIVFVLAVVYMVVSAKKAPGREAVVEPGAQLAEGESADGADGEGTDAAARADTDAEAKTADGAEADAEAEADAKVSVEKKPGAEAAESAKDEPAKDEPAKDEPEKDGAADEKPKPAGQADEAEDADAPAGSGGTKKP